MNPFITDPGQAMGIFPKDLPTFTWKEVDVSGRIACPMLTTVAVFKEIKYICGRLE